MPSATKILEFQFNPAHNREPKLPVWLRRKHRQYFFESSRFYPANKTEKPLGNLCLIAETASQDFKTRAILLSLARVVRKEYYRFFYPNPADCFKWALEQGNRFLSRQLKQDNNNWLGKINFAALSSRADLSISLAKIGQPPVLLLTNNEVFDLSRSLSQEGLPFQYFSNVIEGEIKPQDKLLLLTQDIFEVFDEEEMLRWLLPTRKPSEIKKIFQQKKPALRQAVGACLIVCAKKPSRWPLSFRKVWRLFFCCGIIMGADLF